MSKAKDMLLEDAIKTAIEAEKKNIVIKRTLRVMMWVNWALLLVIGVLLCELM